MIDHIDDLDSEAREPTIGRVHGGGFASQREPLTLDEELNGRQPRASRRSTPGRVPSGVPATPRGGPSR